MNVLPYVCLFTTCRLGAHRGQKGASDPVEPELWMPVSHNGS